MNDSYDYIIVGSGAGGGPLAARLASAGYSVLLLEAGALPKGPVYDVPAYHSNASQSPETRWDFWVRHYSDEQQQRDSKFRAEIESESNSAISRRVDGVLYPRAAALGGCTAHHALITLYPHDSDWERIEQMTGDESWSPQNMRRIFAQSVERCGYRDPVDPSAAGHGFAVGDDRSHNNWLATEIPDMGLLTEDPNMLRIMVSAILKSSTISREVQSGLVEQLHQLLMASGRPESARQLTQSLVSKLDPNVSSGIASGREGVYLVPLSTNAGSRVGARDVVRKVRSLYPEKLKIVCNALATEILLEQSAGSPTPRAVGVRYAKGPHLYEADPKYDAWHGQHAEFLVANARKEVILSAGTFNTPQLLLLSGIGPEATLREHGIAPRVLSEGVGRNLHDRYEIAVINRVSDSFFLWNDAQLDPSTSDPQYENWLRTGRGMYATSGATLAFIRRSQPNLDTPDLFIFGLPVFFKGYYPEYDKDTLCGGGKERRPDVFTWAILMKSPTTSGMERGTVTLRSESPFVRPAIQFRFFPRGPQDPDAQVLADAVRFVRSISGEPGSSHDLFRSELQPGAEKQSDKELCQWVRDEAWGHHACGTCRIGSGDDEKEAQRGFTPAVVDSKFRVRGVSSLRIVDASVFPEIPGFFISTPIYMIAEKAAEDILGSG